MLAHGPAARDHDADVGGGHVHPFVQDPGRDERVAGAGREVLQDPDALGDPGLVGDDRRQKAAGQRVGGVVALGEQQRAVAPVPVQQRLHVGQLGGRRERELLLALVRGQCPPAFDALRRADDELRPAVRVRHADALADHELAVDAARLVVRPAFVPGQLHENPLDGVLGQIPAGEVARVPAADDRSHQRLEVRVAAVDALRGRAQPQPVRRQAVLGGQRVGGARQMVALVEHRQAEARAEVLHVDEGGVVGRDGDRLDQMVAAADDADRAPKPVAQQTMPLRDQIQGRRHDERVAPHRVDGQQRDLGLAGARRQHDHAAPLRGAPGVQRLRLERARLPAHLQAAVQRPVPPRFVLVRDPAPHERPHHRRVGGGGRAEPARARVPAAGVRQPGALRLGETADVQRAGDEAQGNRQGSRGAGRRGPPARGAPGTAYPDSAPGGGVRKAGRPPAARAGYASIYRRAGGT